MLHAGSVRKFGNSAEMISIKIENPAQVFETSLFLAQADAREGSEEQAVHLVPALQVIFKKAGNLAATWAK